MELKTDGMSFYLVNGVDWIKIPDEAVRWIYTDEDDGYQVTGIILDCEGRMDDELFIPGKTIGNERSIIITR